MSAQDATFMHVENDVTPMHIGGVSIFEGPPPSFEELSYFDNVGGEILDEVLRRLARGARVVICGAISQYNAEQPPRGPANYMQLLVMRASMAGFLVFDFAERYPEAIAQLAEWLNAGKLQSREDIVRAGIESFPEVFLMLFRGENTGKLVIKIADE